MSFVLKQWVLNQCPSSVPEEVATLADPVAFENFPRQLTLLTEVQGLVVEIKGWFLLWHPLLFCYEVELQLEDTPADIKRWGTRIVNQELAYLDGQYTKISTPPVLHASVRAVSIHLRAFTALTAEPICKLLRQRFIADARRRGVKQQTIVQWTFDMDEAFRTLAETDDYEGFRWVDFLHAQADGQSPDHWSLMWLFDRANIDYLCVSEYPDLLRILPFRKLAILAPKLLGALQDIIEKKSMGMIRLFYGLDSAKTLSSLAHTGCPYEESSEAVHLPVPLTKKKPEKKVHKRKRIIEEEDEKVEQKELPARVSRKRKRPCKKTSPATQSLAEMIFRRFWGPEVERPATGCPCVTFKGRAEPETEFEQNVPTLQKLFTQLPAKLARVHQDCVNISQSLDCVASRHVERFKHEAKEEDKQLSPINRERQKQLLQVFAKYRFRLDLAEMLALHYGRTQLWRETIAQMPHEEVRRLWFYHCLLTDNKLADGHTMTQLILDQQSPTPSLTIRWHKLQSQTIRDQYELGVQLWKTSVAAEAVGSPLPPTAAQFTHVFFGDRYGNKHARECWVPELTVKELSLFPVLLDWLGPPPLEWEDVAARPAGALCSVMRPAPPVPLPELYLFLQPHHTQLIFELVQMGYLWFTPEYEEKVSVEGHTSSPYHLFLYETLYQVSSAVITLQKVYRHLSVCHPIVPGLIHPLDLSEDLQKEYFPGLHNVMSVTDPIEAQECWETYRQGFFVPVVQAPEPAKGKSSMDKSVQYRRQYNDYPGQLCPPVCAEQWNPFFLTHSDGKYDGVPLPEYPRKDGRAEKVTWPAYRALSLNQYRRPDAEQQKAIDTCFTQPFTLVVGPAGSGKTASVLPLLRCVSEFSILTLAPTHQVRQTITKKIRNAMTIDSLLQEAMVNPFFDSKYQYIQVLALDETSMLSERSACDLIQILPRLPMLRRFIGLGDNRQLPPVAGGAILRDLQNMVMMSLCELKGNHRLGSTKLRTEGLGALQAAYWTEDWPLVRSLLWAGPGSKPRGGVQPLPADLSSEDLMALLEKNEADRKTQLQKVGPRPPPGEDLIEGLRVVGVSSVRTQIIYDYVYQCIRNEFPVSRCITFRHKQRQVINHELARRHLHALPISVDLKRQLQDVSWKGYGLVVGLPYQVLKRTHFRCLVSGQKLKQNPNAKWVPAFVNDTLWCHEIAVIGQFRKRKRMTQHALGFPLYCTSLEQQVPDRDFKAQQPLITLRAYLKKYELQLVVKMQPTPPAAYAKPTPGWHRPRLPMPEDPPPPPRPGPPLGGVRSESPPALGQRCSVDLRTQQAMRRKAFAVRQGLPVSSSSVAPPAPLTISLPSTATHADQWLFLGGLILQETITEGLCRTIDSMQGTESANIHYFLDEGMCSSARVKVALSRAQLHCDVYVSLPNTYSTRGDDLQRQAVDRLVDSLERPTPSRHTALDVLAPFYLCTDELK